jgi:Ni,Fe-hydrogenase I large subunit
LGKTAFHTTNLNENFAEADDSHPAKQMIQRIHQLGWHAIGDCKVTAMPAMEATLLYQQLNRNDADNWTAQPDWQGKTMETGPLSRQWHKPVVQAAMKQSGTGLLTRLAALLAEVQSLLSEQPTTWQQQAPAAETGLAQLETARGRLIHCLRIKQNKVGYYRIVAPTEWNFHPRGSAARALATLTEHKPDALLQQASLLTLLLNPCVEHQITIDNQANNRKTKDPKKGKLSVSCSEAPRA